MKNGYLFEITFAYADELETINVFYEADNMAQAWLLVSQHRAASTMRKIAILEASEQMQIEVNP